MYGPPNLKFEYCGKEIITCTCFHIRKERLLLAVSNEWPNILIIYYMYNISHPNHNNYKCKNVKISLTNSAERDKISTIVCTNLFGSTMQLSRSIV